MDYDVGMRGIREVVSDQIYSARGSVSYSDFAKQNQLDGMEQVTLEDRVTVVWPTGAVFLKTTGAMYGPPEDPRLLADWREKYARANLVRAVKTFNECKRQAQQNPLGFNWLPDLTRLRDIAVSAQNFFDQCHEEYEIQNGRGPEWQRRQKEAIAESERSQQYQQQIHARAMAAIQEIKLNDTTQTQEDEDGEIVINKVVSPLTLTEKALRPYLRSH
jgi:hypothetical protein